MSLPTLPSPLPSPSCSISFSLLLFLFFFFWGVGTGSYCLSLPNAIKGSTGHPALQEITFKQGLEAILGHGCHECGDNGALWMVCAQVWEERWTVACSLSCKKEVQCVERLSWGSCLKTMHQEFWNVPRGWEPCTALGGLHSPASLAPSALIQKSPK